MTAYLILTSVSLTCFIVTLGILIVSLRDMKRRIFFLQYKIFSFEKDIKELKGEQENDR